MMVANFLQEIRSSFLSRDMDAIISLYALPFSVILENSTLFIDTEELLIERVEKILGQIDKLEVADVSFKLVSQIAVGGALTIMRYENIMHFADGRSTLPAYGTAILRETQGKLSIAAAVNPTINSLDLT